MRIVLQRVKKAGVSVNGKAPKAIGEGLALLVGINASDSRETADYIAEKIANLRIFDDKAGNLNRSLLECNGECLVISNFTLYASCKKGRRPSFIEAAPAEISRKLYEYFVSSLSKSGIRAVVDGEFGAHMQVEIVNDGPVTLILDSSEIMPNKGEIL